MTFWPYVAPHPSPVEDVQSLTCVILQLFNHAQDNKYAIPAINVTSSSTVVAALEAARDSKSPIILQVSQGGAAYFAGKGVSNDGQAASIAGSVAAAHYIRSVPQIPQ
jgi:fructose-bisphosphate aldolase, class II